MARGSQVIGQPAADTDARASHRASLQQALRVGGAVDLGGLGAPQSVPAQVSTVTR